jgi:hypothetical protein
MPLFSEHYGIGLPQHELDFVDVPIDGDIPLFIDPFAISLRVDRWSQHCNSTIISYFDKLLTAIRAGQDEAAIELLCHFKEPNETRLGLSEEEPQGAGIGMYQSGQLLRALKSSTAVRTGFISSLEESELLVKGISFDKISDLTTNIIRKQLVEYTKEQCNLFSLPLTRVPLSPYYSAETGEWISDYFELPVANGKPVLLVPKIIARYKPSYQHPKYYNHFVLNYLQAEHLSANSSLVKTLKNGRKVVYKSDIRPTFPGTKENLFLFSKEHPEIMHAYRDTLMRLEKEGKHSIIKTEDEATVARALITGLQSISPGNEAYSDYHKFMMGIVEFLFFPYLIYPRKEQEIHQGRKRIDIVMENGAMNGVFFRMHQVKGLPCAYIFFECKNYVTDIANPELDQLAGRFSVNRGKMGILCCRSFENRQLFIERCRDTLGDGRGLIIPLDDNTVIRWLGLIADRNRGALESELTRLVDEVWLS